MKRKIIKTSVSCLNCNYFHEELNQCAITNPDSKENKRYSPSERKYKICKKFKLLK